jgi:NMD protein affecting ribosome stability and mRNA decay
MAKPMGTTPCDDCGKLPEVFLLYWMGRGICQECYSKRMNRVWGRH